MPTLTLNKPKKPASPDFRKFIIQWNNAFPWDYLWRKKNNVAFGSPTHLASSFVAMCFELREAKIYQNQLNTNLNEKRRKPLTPAQKLELLKPALVTKEDKEISEEEFDNLDLSEYNTPGATPNG